MRRKQYETKAGGGSRWRSGFSALAILGLPVLIAAVIFGPTALDLFIHRRPPERYIVPAGYAGWVRIDYRQPNAPALPIENGRRVLKLDAQGKLATSDGPPPSGYAKDEFFETTTSGFEPLPYVGVCKGGMIWGRETPTDKQTGKEFTRFFVGSEDQYRHEIDPTGKNSPACE
jgi:hypothetical protein